VTVGVARAETAPLVGGAKTAQRRQGRIEAFEDVIDHAWPDLRALVTDVEGPADQQPPALQLGGHRGDGARQPQFRRLGDEQMALDPLGRHVEFEPVEERGQPGREHHRTGMDVTSGRPDRDHPAAPGRHREGGDAGGDQGQHRGQPGDSPQRVDPGLVPDHRSGHGQRQAGDELRHLARIEPLDGRRLMGSEASRVGRQADPVEMHQPDTPGPGLLQLTPPGQARPREVHERRGITPFVDLRGEQAGSTTRGPGAQVAGLDEQHRAEPGLVAGRGGGDARDPAAHDEHIGAWIGYLPTAARELRAFAGGELVAPDGDVNGHDPIVFDCGGLQHGNGRAGAW
jgi:hypothetical protein